MPATKSSTPADEQPNDSTGVLCGCVGFGFEACNTRRAIPVLPWQVAVAWLAQCPLSRYELAYGLDDLARVVHASEGVEMSEKDWLSMLSWFVDDDQ
jgi:hypothetical protein